MVGVKFWKHTHTQFLPLLQRKWYVTWPKISDLEAIGIHTHDSHPVKIRLVIWQFSGWKFAPRSPLVRETGSTFQKSMLGYCNHHDTQLVNMPWWRFDRKLLQESLLWIRFLQKKAGTTQLKASKFDTLLRHISIEHISIECVMLLMQCPQKEKQRCLGVSSWFRAVSMLNSVSFQLHEGSCKTVKPNKMRFKGFEQEGQRCLWLAKANVKSSLPSHLISMCVLRTMLSWHKWVKVQRDDRKVYYSYRIYNFLK